MKKRAFYLIATAIIALAAFVACGERPGDEDKDPKIQITLEALAYFDVKIEVKGAGKMTIKWGDETAVEKHVISDTATYFRHSYKKSASYTISITGNISFLNCGANQITLLDVSKHPNMSSLDCSNNRLTNLDISKNTSLRYLNCSGNDLINLDVTHCPNMKELFCGGNRLERLEVGKHNLTKLHCSGNYITSLDLGYSTSLTELFCSRNKLTTLDVSWNSQLIVLDCSSNAADPDHRLSSLDLSRNSWLKNVGCSANGFSENALNALFGTLHDNATPKEYAIDVTGNPGSYLCDPTIAEAKGWKVFYR